MKLSECCAADLIGSETDPICSYCREHAEAIDETVALEHQITKLKATLVNRDDHIRVLEMAIELALSWWYNCWMFSNMDCKEYRFFEDAEFSNYWLAEARKELSNAD